MFVYCSFIDSDENIYKGNNKKVDANTLSFCPIYGIQ